MKEFFPSGLSKNNLDAWESALRLISRNTRAKIVPVSVPNSKYTMSVYSILTSCEVASNFSRFDGLRFGHHTELDFSLENSSKLEYNFEKLIAKNRSESLGKVVKSRFVSGNYFLLKE